jgi:hypothetical protein
VNSRWLNVITIIHDGHLGGHFVAANSSLIALPPRNRFHPTGKRGAI